MEERLETNVNKKFAVVDETFEGLRHVIEGTGQRVLAELRHDMLIHERAIIMACIALAGVGVAVVQVLSRVL